MELAAMGRVIVTARIENLDDLFEVSKSQRAEAEVRTITVDDALVDTGAILLSLPTRLIAQLGLRQARLRTARTPAGTMTFKVYFPVRLTVNGRECTTEVCEVPDACPVLIGQIPLEMLDFLVDPVAQRLIGNPAHGGEQMIELFYCPRPQLIE